MLEPDGTMLSPEQRAALLRRARAAVLDAASGGAHVASAAETDSTLMEPRGVFVSLRSRRGIRGCVGTTVEKRPLWRSVDEMARASATRDSRFEPVTPEEVGDLVIEISILDSLEPISTPDDIEIGQHGLVVEGRGCRGLLLPQVAGAQGWDATRLAEQTCKKAGLEPEAYVAGDVSLYRFRADVFSEA